MATGKLELYPWRHDPSRVWGRADPGASGDRRGHYIAWRNVGDDFGAFVAQLLDRLPTEAVWVSIDKDVLRPADALTNWDQGEMPLDALTEALRLIGQRARIVGLDVCGEYSPPRHRLWSKRWEAWADQPRPPRVEPADLTRNAHANAALLAALQGVRP